MPAEVGPARGPSAVDRIGDPRIGAGCEQCLALPWPGRSARPGASRSRPVRGRGRRTCPGGRCRRRARAGARSRPIGRWPRPRSARCRGRGRRRRRRRARRAGRVPPHGRSWPPTRALRRGSPEGRPTAARSGSRCAGGRSRARLPPPRAGSRPRARGSRSGPGGRGRPRCAGCRARCPALPGSRRRRACPQKSAAASGVPPSPCASRSVRAPASSSRRASAMSLP